MLFYLYENGALMRNLVLKACLVLYSVDPAVAGTVIGFFAGN